MLLTQSMGGSVYHCTALLSADAVVVVALVRLGGIMPAKEYGLMIKTKEHIFWGMMSSGIEFCRGKQM